MDSPCNYAVELTHFRAATFKEIKEIISTLKNSSCESDAIPTPFLKACAETLIPILTTLVNLSLTRSEFPSCLKHAAVRPLLKKSP